MSVNPSGRTQLYLSVGVAQGNRDALLHQLEKVAGDHFAIFGEIGFGQGAIYYLARRLDTAELKALKLTRGTAGNSFDLDVLDSLDSSVPTHESQCPECGRRLEYLSNFCPWCRADLRGDTGPTQEQLLQGVKGELSGTHQILGGMAFGQGHVFFGRELRTGRLVSFRLVRSGMDERTGRPRYDMAKVSTLRLPGALDRPNAPSAPKHPTARPEAPPSPPDRPEDRAPPPPEPKMEERPPPPTPPPDQREPRPDPPERRKGAGERRNRGQGRGPRAPSVPALQILALLGTLGLVVTLIFIFVL